MSEEPRKKEKKMILLALSFAMVVSSIGLLSYLAYDLKGIYYKLS
jgi:hypothetical protein